jgi:hypothetical protein
MKTEVSLHFIVYPAQGDGSSKGSTILDLFHACRDANECGFCMPYIFRVFLRISFSSSCL